MPEDSPGVAAQTAKWTVKAQWPTQSCRAQPPGCQTGLTAPSSSVRARPAAGVPPATQTTQPTPVSRRARSPAGRLQSSRRGQPAPPQHAPDPSEGRRPRRSTAEQQAAQPQHVPYPSVSLPADQHRRSSRPSGAGDQPSAGPGECRESRRTTADGRPNQSGDAGSGRVSNFGQGAVHQQWPGADASVAVSHPGGLSR